MLRVDLCEHEQLDVGWVTEKRIWSRDEGINEVLDLVEAEGETEALVGLRQAYKCLLSGNLDSLPSEELNGAERTRRGLGEKLSLQR